MNRVLLIICLLISQVAVAQWQPPVFYVSQKDFKEIISYSSYDESKNLYSYKFRNYNKCDIETLKKFFSKQENLTLMSCITYTEKISTGGYSSYDKHIVQQFTFRKVNWKLNGPEAGLLLKNKKNTIEKAAQEALERGKGGNIFYMAYIPDEDKYKIEGWIKKHPEFKLGNIGKSFFEFGLAREVNEYKANKEIFAEVNSKILERIQDNWGFHYKLANVDLIIETKEKYPDYSINISKYNTSKSIEDYLQSYQYWNLDQLARFIAVFPEYPFMIDVAWTPYRYRPEAFLQVFNNHHSYVENKIYNDLEKAYHTGKSPLPLRETYKNAKTAIPLLEKTTDISRIRNMMNLCFEKDLKLCQSSQEHIEACMIYTGNTYFSRNEFSDYYQSAKDFRTLVTELKKCKPLLQRNAGIEDEVYSAYFDQRFKNGVNEWKNLLADFPDQRNRIMLYTRRFIDRPSSYSQHKWKEYIQQALQWNSQTINNLNAYINAGIPDNEGQQLAKKYLGEASSIAAKYRADLNKAEAYESTIRSRIERIRRQVEETQFIPPYKVKSRKRYNEYCEEVNLSIDLNRYSSFEFTIYYDYDEGVYYDSTFGSSFKKSDGIKTLNEFVWLYAQDNRKVILWDYELGKAENLQHAEKIIRQYDELGINRWWEIEY